jgi:hypothetical protein
MLITILPNSFVKLSLLLSYYHFPPNARLMFLSRSLSGILRKRQYDPQNAGLDNLPVIQAGHHMRICIEKTTSEITYTK